jgi:hypothetical protein
VRYVGRVPRSGPAGFVRHVAQQRDEITRRALDLERAADRTPHHSALDARELGVDTTDVPAKNEIHN